VIRRTPASFHARLLIARPILPKPVATRLVSGSVWASNTLMVFSPVKILLIQ
jgi:hypothetical protein